MQFQNPRDVKTSFLEQFALIGKALSNPIRLEILDLLCQTERTVDALAQESSVSTANASQHLQILRQAGLVVSRREKNFVYYRIAGDEVCGLWKTVQKVGGLQLAEISRTVANYFDARDELQILERDDILKQAEAGEIVLLDVRPVEEYRHAHIRGATSIPLKDLKARIADLPKDKAIVAYCRGPYCVLSQEAVKILRNEGLNAYRISDGVNDCEKNAIEENV